MYVPLGRYNYVAKVINNAHTKVKIVWSIEITDVTCPRKMYANYGEHYTLISLTRIAK